MDVSKKSFSAPTFAVFLLIVACIACVFAAIRYCETADAATNPSEDAACAEGVSYIYGLEGKDAGAVSDGIKQARYDKMMADIDSQLSEDSVWGLFDDYAILGDSRAVGFWYYDYLSPSRVLAEGGETIRDVDKHMDDLAALNPATVFFCFGINDVSIGYWASPEEYCAELDQVIARVKERCPRATVYVNSILICRDPAFERSELWRNIPDWNAYIKTHCEQTQIAYIDNDWLCESYADLWDEDGIHVRKMFYPLWARNMMEPVLVANYD